METKVSQQVGMIKDHKTTFIELKNEEKEREKKNLIQKGLRGKRIGKEVLNIQPKEKELDSFKLMRSEREISLELAREEN